VIDPKIEAAVASIRTWGEERDWLGYDPYDALNSPFAGALTLGTRLGRRVLTQAVKISPLNLRPALAIRPAHNAKAIGLVASAYSRLAGSNVEGAALAARRWRAWLGEHRAGDGGDPLWGYHFPVQTRVFAYAANAPNTIASTFVLQAFLDAAELEGDDESLEVARAGANALVRRLGRERDGVPFFRYLEGEDELIHNANALACAVLARVARLAGDAALADIASKSLRVTLDAQRPDGSWPYSEREQHGWVDNFHTGYVLESLAHCVPLFPELGQVIERGVAYWRDALFLPDGRPMYDAGSLYPLDGHCYAQAVETWLAVRDVVPGAVAEARRSAHLLVDTMVDPRGFVIFQRRRGLVNRVPFVRWTTAPSFRALAGLCLDGRS
jgi:hypothetical protein